MNQRDSPVLPPWVKRSPDGLELRIKVVPGASQTGIAGILGNRLKVRVAAPPENGKANAAVVKLLSEVLDGQQGAVIHGQTAPEKTVWFKNYSEKKLLLLIEKQV